MKRILCVLLIFSLCIITGCTKSAQQYYEAAEKYLTAGQYDKAIENFQQVIKIDSKNVDAYISLASAYQQNNQNDEFKNTLSSALENNSDLSADNYIKIANMFKDSNNQDLYLQTLKAGFKNTNDSSIKKLIDSSISTLKTVDIKSVYNTLFASGLFGDYSTAYHDAKYDSNQKLIPDGKIRYFTLKDKDLRIVRDDILIYCKYDDQDPTNSFLAIQCKVANNPYEIYSINISSTNNINFDDTIIGNNSDTQKYVSYNFDNTGAFDYGTLINSSTYRIISNEKYSLMVDTANTLLKPFGFSLSYLVDTDTLAYLALSYGD